MDNINNFDPSYSPSEKFEAVDRPDCLTCGDTGSFVSGDGLNDWCDCAAGMARADSELQSEGYQMTDVEADADTLASAGYGTDEDYGFYGDTGYDGVGDW